MVEDIKIVGYKGKTFDDSDYIFAPYIPIDTSDKNVEEILKREAELLRQKENMKRNMEQW